MAFPNDILLELFWFFNDFQISYWMEQAKTRKELQTLLYKRLETTSVDNVFTILLMKYDNWDPIKQPLKHKITLKELKSILQTSSARCLQLFLRLKLVSGFEVSEICETTKINLDNLGVITENVKTPDHVLSMWWNDLLKMHKDDDDDTVLQFGMYHMKQFPNFNFPRCKVDVQCMRVLRDACGTSRIFLLGTFTSLSQSTNVSKIDFACGALTMEPPQFDVLDFVEDITYEHKNSREWKLVDKLLEHKDKLPSRFRSFVEHSCYQLKHDCLDEHICYSFGECLHFGYVFLATWLWDNCPNQRFEFQLKINAANNLYGLRRFIKVEWPHLNIRQNPALLTRVAFSSECEESIIRFMCANQLWEKHPEQWVWTIWDRLITHVKPTCVDHFWNLLSREQMQEFVPELLGSDNGIRRANKYNLQISHELLANKFLALVYCEASNLLEQLCGMELDPKMVTYTYRYVISYHSLESLQILWHMHPLPHSSVLLARYFCISDTPNPEIGRFLLTCGAVYKQDLWDVCTQSAIPRAIIQRIFAAIHFDID